MRAIKAILFRNLTAFSRDKMRFFFTLFMSGFFLFIFSFVMKAAATGIAAPMSYLISGIIIMTVFQSALNNSMNIIEDVASGFMKEIMVAPIARWQISLGQIASATVISVLQGMLIVIIGLFIGLKLDLFHFIEMGVSDGGRRHHFCIHRIIPGDVVEEFFNVSGNDIGYRHAVDISIRSIHTNHGAAGLSPSRHLY